MIQTLGLRGSRLACLTQQGKLLESQAGRENGLTAILQTVLSAQCGSRRSQMDMASSWEALPAPIGEEAWLRQSLIGTDADPVTDTSKGDAGVTGRREPNARESIKCRDALDTGVMGRVWQRNQVCK
ncbi:hypothetical protein UY3_16047 [Chelonia mydas]|uniref:Uncharacterized protein n=1 Tax=Chelonia mydas TaxID=8469 RepID=M7BF89_CHEMY|nr:hypothetical protein UY3_16047 [Chelonia mydas]